MYMLIIKPFTYISGDMMYLCQREKMMVSKVKQKVENYYLIKY